MKGPGYLAVAIQPGPNTDEEAFHHWYNTEHGPLRLRLPFILTGDRYKVADDQKPGWSAVYDVSDLSMLEKRIYTRLREERSQQEKKVMSTFDSLDRKIYSTVSVRGDSKDPAPVQLAVSMRLKDEDADDFNKWYEEEHTSMLSKVPGWLRTRRFKLEVGGLTGMPPQGQTEYLAVHDYAAPNGLNGPEHEAARSTPWRSTIMTKILWHDRRLWSHHLSFDALEEPPSSVTTTDGADLRFQLEGNPADPVIVCVNSILTTLHIWDDVAAALKTGLKGGQTYRVLRYNPRGYSPLPSRSNPTTFDLLADDLEYLLQRLEIPKVHAVLGVSMGGVTAMNFAIRHPDMLEKFIACDCNIASAPANSAAWGERIELARSKGMAALADVTVKRWFNPANHSSAEAKKVEAMVAQADLEGFVGGTAALCDYDLRGKVGGIRVPGLLVAGEGDGKLPEAMAGGFGIEGVGFRGVAGAGHLPMLENLGGFMEVLGGFL
ncbi:hypothetical protein LTS01_020309 [Friedmanniomyces endolithicus]|nr:hypothetical protein LTS01_020309 [Friedmanniomyces endolithicus]